MTNYLYGLGTMGLIGAMVNVIDQNVPNNLWYWLDLYLPF